jgi:hypothetical protein
MKFLNTFSRSKKTRKRTPLTTKKSYNCCLKIIPDPSQEFSCNFPYNLRLSEVKWQPSIEKSSHKWFSIANELECISKSSPENYSVAKGP